MNETANNMKWKAQGTAKYVAAVVGTLRRFTPAQFEVTVDGEHRSLSGMLIAVGNGESYGGGMRVTAGASLTTGRSRCASSAECPGPVPAGVPQGVPRNPRDPPQGDDAQRHPGGDLIGPALRRVRRWGTSVPLPAVFEVLPGSLKVAFPKRAPRAADKGPDPRCTGGPDVTDTLVLIHGFPLDGSQWEPQTGALSGTLQVLAPSLPGFGGQPGVGPVMTMEAAAGRVLEGMDAAQVDRAVVCGLSMGGYVAFEMWRRAPERFQGLILANTRSGADDEAGRERRLALADRLGAEGATSSSRVPARCCRRRRGETRRTVRGIVAAQPAESIAAASPGDGRTAGLTADFGGIVPNPWWSSRPAAPHPAEVTALDSPEHPRRHAGDDRRRRPPVEHRGPGEFTLLLERHLTICGLL